MLKFRITARSIRWFIVLGTIIIISFLTVQRFLEKLTINEELKKLSTVHQIGRFDQDLGWALIPNTEAVDINLDFLVRYAINSYGIRDEEFTIEKTEDIFRIVVLGESNVFGLGVEYGKRFSEVVEHACRKVEVINMGVNGFGIDQSLLQLKRDVFLLQPDLVIITVAIEHYLKRALLAEFCGKAKPRFIVDKERRELILDKVKPLNAMPKPLEDTRVCCLNSWSLLRRHLKESGAIDMAGSFFDFRDRGDYFYQLIFLLLKDFSQTCKQQAVPLCVFQTHPIGVKMLSQITDELNIEYIDISKKMRKSVKYGSFRFSMDSHYTPYAHRIAGEYLAKYLLEKYRLKKNPDFIAFYLPLLDRPE